LFTQRIVEERQLIRITGICKTFDRMVALSEISLQIEAGELVLLTGPSGAGKTTLLQMLIAAIRPDRGAIEVDGADITRLRRSSVADLRRNIGMVFQDFRLLPQLTTLENVGLALEVRGVSRYAARRKALRTLSAIGLLPRAHQAVAALSGGERQRVAVARALVGDPKIVLADEPTGNLDPPWARDILWLLNRASHRGTTVIVATHDPALIAAADYTQCAKLADGRLVELIRRTRSASDAGDPDETPSDAREDEHGTRREAGRG
jgi:cell division transport system ATP-binding protein